MPKSKINRTSVKAKIKKSLDRKGAQQKLYQKVHERFLIKKQQLISDFENHPVTREIQEGPSAANISGTLGGYGNLYSFIGFDGGDPTGDVSRALRAGIRLQRRPRKSKRGKSILYHYIVAFPSMEELSIVARMPWEPGNWVSRIERGISGFGSYMYNKMNVKGSRSGKAFQAKAPGKYIAPQKIRPGRFRNVKYMT